MTEYAICMTWLVGFVMGIIALGAVFIVIDGKQNKQAAEARNARRRESAQMDQAVALIQDELGGSVLSYENN